MLVIDVVRAEVGLAGAELEPSSVFEWLRFPEYRLTSRRLVASGAGAEVETVVANVFGTWMSR